MTDNGSAYRSTVPLAGWLDYYNQRRPHGSLCRQAPGERLAQLMNNVPQTYT